MRPKYLFAGSFRSRRPRSSALFSRGQTAMIATLPSSEMWRSAAKRLLCRRCHRAIALTKGLRCRPANTNLHTIRTRNAITDRIADAIKFRRRGDGLPLASDSALCQRSLTLPAGIVSPAAAAPLTACDGMNHQDFILLARNLLYAFTGRHVKWLRAGLGFVLGNHSVYFFHVGGFGIVFEKCRIAVRGKCQNFGVHVRSPAGRPFAVFCGTAVSGVWVPVCHIAPFPGGVKMAVSRCHSRGADGDRDMFHQWT